MSSNGNCKTHKNSGISTFQGDTLKMCRHNHTNILMKGCRDIESSLPCSPNEREQAKQQLYDSKDVENESSQLNGIPQNLIEALGLDWDIYNDFVCTLPQDTCMIVTTEVPQQIFTQQENLLETVTKFPIEVVSGVSMSM